MPFEQVQAVVLAVLSSGAVAGIVSQWGKAKDQHYSETSELRQGLKDEIGRLREDVEHHKTETTQHQAEINLLREDLDDCRRNHRRDENEIEDLRGMVTAQQRMIDVQQGQIDRLLRLRERPGGEHRLADDV